VRNIKLTFSESQMWNYKGSDFFHLELLTHHLAG